MIPEIINYFRNHQLRYIIIYGATASGKSDFALKLANELQSAIIINADSMQVYKEIPILTAQPINQINHYLYGFISCKDHFSVAEWLHNLKNLLNDERHVIIVGGTGLYISSLINGLSNIPHVDESIVNKLYDIFKIKGIQPLINQLMQIDYNIACKICDPQRVIRALSVYEATGKSMSYWQQKSHTKYINTNQALQIFIKPKRNILYSRINDRFLSMIDNGVLKEVHYLIEQNYTKYPKAIGLSDIISYINKEITIDNMISNVQKKSRNYAKRQETWFNNQCRPEFVLI